MRRGQLGAVAGLALICTVTSTPWMAAGAEPARTGESLIEAIEGAQGDLADLSARFEQVRFVPLFEESLSSSGEILFRRPGSLLIRYDTPDSSVLAVSDSMITLYYPDLEQAHLFEIGDESTVSALLLGFAGSFREAQKYFSFSEGAREGDRPVLLAEPLPDSPAAADIELITLTIDPKRWLPVRTCFRETNGDETCFEFRRLERNRGLPASLFVLSLPPGTEIIEMRP